MVNQQFIQCLFNLMNTELFGKCVKVIRTLLTVSKYAKSVQHTNFKDALQMTGMTNHDQQFIKKMVDTLLEL